MVSRVESEMEEAHSRVDQSAESLRAELRRVEQAAEDANIQALIDTIPAPPSSSCHSSSETKANDGLCVQHSTWKREAQRRQGVLETANAELTSSLAIAERKLNTFLMNASPSSSIRSVTLTCSLSVE